MVNITSKMILAQLYRDAVQRILFHIVSRETNMAPLIDNMVAWGGLAYFIHFNNEDILDNLLKSNAYGFNGFAFAVGTSNCNGTDIEQQLTNNTKVKLFYNNGTTVVDTDGSVSLWMAIECDGEIIFETRSRMEKL